MILLSAAIEAASTPTLAHSINQDLWSFEIPPLEKIIRTVAVYAAIVVIIRIAGKRLMAQMNSLDLVVVLLLSNVVQNAIIGSDNSLSGGLLGAVVLVAVNAVLERVAQKWPAFRVASEGKPTVVVQDGKVVDGSLSRLGMTRGELRSALHRQGADEVEEVQHASLDPGGSISVDLLPQEQNVSRGEFAMEMAKLHRSLDDLATAVAARPSR